MSHYHKNDPSTIQSMFNSIAHNYDKANAVLSFQLHKKWNLNLVKQIQLKDPSHNYLDLCCGTGDIASYYLKQVPNPCQTYLVDFSSNMLSCAKNKMSPFDPRSIHYIQADVMDLPFASESMHCATMAYGIRNVKDPAQSLREVYRVLKPGGVFGILELTQPKNCVLRLGHQIYLRFLLPILGKWLTDNPEAYQYLQSSIQSFIAPNELEKMLQQSRFTKTKQISLAGGIATILIGYKEVNEEIKIL